MGSHITTVGLVFDIIGVVILFYYGPPVGSVGLEGSETIVTEPDPERAKVARREYRISKFGLVLLFVGFVLQVWGNEARNWCTRSTPKQPPPSAQEQPR